MDLYFIADGPALFLHNEAAQSRTLRQHNYVVLQLAGDGTAVSLQAVGTTVMVRSISDVGVERRQAREVRLAPRTHGFDDERLVFGLGPLGRVNEVVVRWPEGTQQRVAGRDLELNEVRVPNLIKFKGGLGECETAGCVVLCMCCCCSPPWAVVCGCVWGRGAECDQTAIRGCRV